MPNVVTTSECGYAFCLTFCHSANKNRYAQIIYGYAPVPTILFIVERVYHIARHYSLTESAQIMSSLIKNAMT